MSENEKRLRAVLARRGEHGAPTTGTFQHEALDALLAEHRAEVESARDAALEEARRFFSGHGQGVFMRETVADLLDALKSRPGELAPDLARLRDGLFALGFATEYPSEAGSIVDCALAVARERRELVLVSKVRKEARRLITTHLTSEAEIRAVATLADAVGANVDDLVPHDWVGANLDDNT